MRKNILKPVLFLKNYLFFRFQKDLLKIIEHAGEKNTAGEERMVCTHVTSPILGCIQCRAWWGEPGWGSQGSTFAPIKKLKEKKKTQKYKLLCF